MESPFICAKTVATSRIETLTCRQTVRSRLNLEMAATMRWWRLHGVKPDMVTLVPERRGGHHGGGRHRRSPGFIKEMVDRLQGDGMPVSLFVDPDVVQLEASRSSGARWVELHTGRYAEASWLQPLNLRLTEGCAIARQLGLRQRRTWPDLSTLKAPLPSRGWRN